MSHNGSSIVTDSRFDPGFFAGPRCNQGDLPGLFLDLLVICTDTIRRDREPAVIRPPLVLKVGGFLSFEQGHRGAPRPAR